MPLVRVIGPGVSLAKVLIISSRHAAFYSNDFPSSEDVRLDLDQVEIQRLDFVGDIANR